MINSDQDRPDYITCCLLGYDQSTETWCGRSSYRNFVFQEPTHAILNARNQGSLVLCAECREEIIKIMNEQK